MKRVLVLDANQRSALAIVRSLGSHGVTTLAADESPTALAGCSRYSYSYTQYPSPSLLPDDFVSHIEKLCNREDIDIIFPVTELTTQLLLRHQHLFANNLLPFANLETVNTLADKTTLMSLAESLNIPIPKTVQMKAGTELPPATSLAYPLVLKPGLSWLQYNNEWLHTNVRFAKNKNTAANILSTDPAFQAHGFLLQESVPGNGAGVFALYDHGKPLAFFSHQRLREKPPRGGVSVLSESTELDNSLLEYSRTLLNHAKWHGIAMVEFRTDGKQPYLMEVNTRFWGSLQLAIDAGIDFPWLLYQVTCSEKINEISGYKKGKRLRWLLGDVDNLYLTLRDKEFSLSHKLRSIIKFFLPDPFKTRHEVNRLDDLKPFWCELKHYLKDLFSSR